MEIVGDELSRDSGWQTTGFEKKMQDQI